jgi:hypothetical protein
VLTVTALGADVAAARATAYGTLEPLAARLGTGRGLTYRSDIADL